MAGSRKKIHACDFFSGCGGTSAGLQAAGIKIVFALDNDPDAARTYQANFPKTSFVEKDIRLFAVDELKRHLRGSESGLRHHLMDPELCEVFAEEYTRHINKLRIDRNASLDGYKAEFERADKELEKLVDAICAGTPPLKVKDRMWELENRKEELTRLIANTEEAPVYIHPNMGKLYRDKVSELAIALNDEACRTEAAEIIRGLIDKIVLNPDLDKPKGLSIDLHGAIAGILSLSQKSKKASIVSDEDLMQVKLVAGVGFEPTTFRL